MTKDEYMRHVADVAAEFLSEYDAKEWKTKHEDGQFSEFMREVEYSGGFHEHVDAYCASSWKEAIDIIQATEQNPDYVDPGLYEGCGWEKILVVIAFEVFSWDVRKKAEEMFNNNTFENTVLPMRNTTAQWGFFPNLKTYRIPKGPYVIACDDFVKIRVPGEEADNSKPAYPNFSVVFEGTPQERKSFYLVPCRRIYVQHKQHIDDAMKRCFEEFGVKEQPQPTRGRKS